MSSLIFYSFLCSVSFSHLVNGLFFHMGETEKRCFIEDIAENTTVTGNVPEILYIFSAALSE